MLVLGLAMIALERLRPGRRWPEVPGWWGRAILLNLGQAGTALLASMFWDRFLARHRLFSLDRLGVLGGAAVGYVAITFVYYWWHRARHQSAFLWRTFHQVHHSAQRIEVITSFYKHPAEIVVNGVLSSAICYLGLGLSPASTSLAVLLTGLAELFYHWNVSTPYWLGFLIQRPESHCIHHQEGVHSYNFADLPLWDILFGTFRNPRAWDARCGFGEKEHRLSEMLRFRDVSRDA